MLSNNYPIKNYEDFKELFVREDGRRKNAVLLAWYKSKAMMGFLRDNIEEMRNARKYDSARRLAGGFTIRDMATLKDFVMRLVMRPDYNRLDRVAERIYTPWGWYPSDKYYSDRQNGLCYDRDYRSFRYLRIEDHRDFKMKMGRLFKHCIECSVVGEVLPREVQLWICEEVQRDWEMHARAQMPEPEGFELHVDDNFANIYNSDFLKGDFGSCMTDNDYYSFYTDAVKAKAAYLTDESGDIVARCVIFTEVEDIETGEVLRLAERQYAHDGKEVLKRDLINALIKGGHIDGYKKIGAGCSDTRLFVSNDGTSWSDRHFRIKCELDYDDTVSYQDSFRYYDIDNYRAYNHVGDCPLGDAVLLCVTGGQMEDNRNYDEYHDNYTSSDLVSVYCGRWMSCAEDDLEDFVDVSGEGWVHYEYCTECPVCGEYFRDGHGHESDMTGDTYCCESCMEDAEEEYKRDNWHWSEYDQEWVEDEDDITRIKMSDGRWETIKCDTAYDLKMYDEAICIDDEWYHADYLRRLICEA